jgi:hypothetical protein
MKFGSFFFELERFTVVTCKFSSYFYKVINQSSAWLRVLMCTDRFYTLNKLQQHRIIDRHRCVLFLIIFTLI